MTKSSSFSKSSRRRSARKKKKVFSTTPGRKVQASNDGVHRVNRRHTCVTILLNLSLSNRKKPNHEQYTRSELYSVLEERHRKLAKSLGVKPAKIHEVFPQQMAFSFMARVKKFRACDVYFQSLIFEEEKGRKDHLRKFSSPEQKALHSTVWCPHDDNFVKAIGRISASAFVLYIINNLHVKPHGSEEPSVLDKYLTMMRHRGVPIYTADRRTARRGVSDIPELGLTVFHENDTVYMPRIGSEWHRHIIYDIMRRKGAIVDCSRSCFCASCDSGFHGRGRFGFIRAQPEDKGNSTSVSKRPSVFSRSSIAGLVEVGTVAQEAVMDKYPSSFKDESRSAYVSENMCSLMGVSHCKWLWEYVDVIVTSKAQLKRHCDYVS